ADSAALWAAASDAATAAFDSATLAAILEDSCSEARRADSDFEAATALSEAAIDSETDSEADIDADSLAFEIDSTFCVLEIMTCSVDSGSGTLSSLFTSAIKRPGTTMITNSKKAITLDVVDIVS